MLGKYLKPSPSRFCGGTSLLWRGNNTKLLRQCSKSVWNLSQKKESLQPEYLFESARAATYHSLVSAGVGAGDEVVISSFTCEAVSYAVFSTGAKVVYVDVNDDLTMRDSDVLKGLNKNTKAVILQNTFGRLGLEESTINALKKRHILIIEDCALSVGSKKEGKALGSFGDIAIYSLEVSKTITIGWGGVATVNNKAYEKAFVQRYMTLKPTSFLADVRRLFQLHASVFLVSRKIPLAIFAWYFFYGTRIFRSSNRFVLPMSNGKEKLGGLSKKVFLGMKEHLDRLYTLTHQNYINIRHMGEANGLQSVVEETENEYIVTPRISFLVDEGKVDSIVKLGLALGLEVGRWFDVCPPPYKKQTADVIACENAKRIASRIINLPCHWTLTKAELRNIEQLLENIKSS